MYIFQIGRQHPNGCATDEELEARGLALQSLLKSPHFSSIIPLQNHYVGEFGAKFIVPKDKMGLIDEYMERYVERLFQENPTDPGHILHLGHCGCIEEEDSFVFLVFVYTYRKVQTDDKYRKDKSRGRDNLQRFSSPPIRSSSPEKSYVRTRLLFQQYYGVLGRNGYRNLYYNPRANRECQTSHNNSVDNSSIRS